MDNDDLAQDWYRFAAMDLNSAKFLCNMRPKPLEIICYHCQQSVEKMLKGYLISNNVAAPKIHDLPLLCKMCIKINDTFQELHDYCEFLNPYGVQPRYPNEIEILEIDVEMALRKVQTILEFFEIKGITMHL